MTQKAKQTDNKDFEIFSKHVFRYVDAFSLGGWDVVSVRDELPEDKVATCQYDIEAMHAVIIFNTNAVMIGLSETFLKKTALHEVQHIAQARMSFIARSGELGQDELFLTSAKHELINMTIHLINTLSDEFK